METPLEKGATRRSRIKGSGVEWRQRRGGPHACASAYARARADGGGQRGMARPMTVGGPRASALDESNARRSPGEGIVVAGIIVVGWEGEHMVVVIIVGRVIPPPRADLIMMG